MNLPGYRLLSPRCVQSDGVLYRAESLTSGEPLDVWLLSIARNDPDRRAAIFRRLKLASLVRHPASSPVVQLELDHAPPFAVLSSLGQEPTFAERTRHVPLLVEQVLPAAHHLASALACAHRVGLVHGQIGPSQIHGQPESVWQFDFSARPQEVPPAREPLAELDRACRAPEAANGEPSTFESDIYAFAACLVWLLTGQPGTPQGVSQATSLTIATTSVSLLPIHDETTAELDRLLRQMLSRDAGLRPTAAEVERRLGALRPVIATSSLMGRTTAFEAEPEEPATGPAATSGDSHEAIWSRAQLGRYRLLAKLGQGGMGAVYRAWDPLEEREVAIKVLRPEWAHRPESLRRFHREARMLADVNNPYVANLLDVNEDDGAHYLVLELVVGRNLEQMLREKTRLDEATAVAIVSDVARALVDAHARNIVHRDIKPENILLVGDGAPGTASSAAAPRVKLTDFGLARHVVESESLNVTRAGTILGTPLYMAPEQASGEGDVGPAADVYSLGCTLFYLLAGRVPFEGDSPLAVMTMHLSEPPPALRKIVSTASEGISQIVARCLAKQPAERFADARALLEALERHARGEPTGIAVHPRIPAGDPAKVIAFDFEWNLEGSCADLWPHVGNTERLNRAIGLPHAKFSAEVQEDGRVRRWAKVRVAGQELAWQEHPYEWIEGRRMGVLREFTSGPFKWFTSSVELEPLHGGGTKLSHRLRIEPRNLLGRTVARIQMGPKTRRGLDRIYRRIDAAVMGKLGSLATVDPFEPNAELRGPRQRLLDDLLDKLVQRGVDPTATERLGDFLAQAPAQEITRIRPLALARRLSLDSRKFVDACLWGAREGLLVLLWDLLCPLCRIPSQIKETLRDLGTHGKCEACNLEFQLDFANSVELIFRADARIREADLGTYCVGGPAHSPHVVAQVRVAAGERFELNLVMSEGAYRLRGAQLGFSLDFRVSPRAMVSQWELNLGRSPDAQLPRALRAGPMRILLTNDHSQELTVRIERRAARDDALTAAQASSLGLFRELFPGEVLSPGQLVSVATVTLLTTELDQTTSLYEAWGDERAFAVIHAHFRHLEECVRREGGALIKTIGEGLVAAFHDPLGAVRAALDMQPALQADELTAGLRLRAGLHCGTAMAATLNDHLDYFGSTVNLASRLPGLAQTGELLLTSDVASEPRVAAWIRDSGRETSLGEVELGPSEACVVVRLRLSS